MSDEGSSSSGAPGEGVALAPWIGRRTFETVGALEQEGVTVHVEDEAFPARGVVDLLRPPAAAHPGDEVTVWAYGGRVVRLRAEATDRPDESVEARLAGLEARTADLEEKVAELADSASSSRSAPKKRPAPRKSAPSRTSPRRAGDTEKGKGG